MMGRQEKHGGHEGCCTQSMFVVTALACALTFHVGIVSKACDSHILRDAYTKSISRLA